MGWPLERAEQEREGRPPRPGGVLVRPVAALVGAPRPTSTSLLYSSSSSSLHHAWRRRRFHFEGIFEGRLTPDHARLHAGASLLSPLPPHSSLLPPPFSSFLLLHRSAEHSTTTTTCATLSSNQTHRQTTTTRACTNSRTLRTSALDILPSRSFITEHASVFGFSPPQ